MLNILFARFKQGYQTIAYPEKDPILPERYRGRLVFVQGKCPPSCQICLEVCPTSAISRHDTHGIRADMGRCLFCGDCVQSCPAGLITHLNNYRIAANTRNELITTGNDVPPAHALEEKIRRIFGRSLKLRQVSAGGCNACEADTNVLSTVGFDLGRFGIQFVASPRHADGLLITGPVTENMKLALEKTYQAVPSPKIVISVGACAISGGIFANHPQVHNGADSTVPVDLYIPGCPPHPMSILDGLLRLLGRI